MAEKKKILVVDDSAFMRRVISDIINNDPRCITIGTASNGKEALEIVDQLKPDVISLDIQMPIMDGLTMLKELNRNHKIPVVMMSTLTKEGAKVAPPRNRNEAKAKGGASCTATFIMTQL